MGWGGATPAGRPAWARRGLSVPRMAPSRPQAFYMIRFHSFYPWHTGGDYRQLCSEQDLAMLPWVQEFKCGHPPGGLGRGGGGGVQGAFPQLIVPPLMQQV